jgi:hypothetical protein
MEYEDSEPAGVHLGTGRKREEMHLRTLKIKVLQSALIKMQRDWEMCTSESRPPLKVNFCSAR